jgi:class 3 adenylate cyclase
VPPKQLSAAAEAWLRRYPWPGNVRELNHLMERLTLLCPDAVLEPAALAQWSLSGSSMVATSPPRPVEADMGTVDEPERIRRALAQTGGNVTRAAKLLGWSRKALRYRRQRYGLEPGPMAFALASQGPEMASSPDLQVPPSVPFPSLVEAPPETLPQGEATLDDPRPPSSGWEQRTVAVLAIDLTLPRATGLTTSPVTSWEVLRRWEEAIAEKIQELGGVFLRRSPPLMVAAFGLPHSLERMPHRAVQAALTIQRLLEDDQLRAGHAAGPELRQAVHLGPVLVDLGVSDPVMRLPAVRDTLALPMRLIGHTAPGEILASAQAARLLEGAFAL